MESLLNAKESNRNLLESFERYAGESGLTTNSRKTYLFYLGRLSQYLKNRGIESLAKCNDLSMVREFIFSINDGAPNRQTIIVAMAAVRNFYRFLHNGELPPWLASLRTPKTKRQVISHYSPNDMWTREDVLEAIKILDHPRDKAIVALLYDVALRPHECAELKISDVKIFEKYATVLIPTESKTGQRYLPVSFAYPYLIAWLNVHPLKEYPTAPLWVKLQGMPTRMTYEGIRMIFDRKLSKRLQQKGKPTNPYILRHSRLTELANTLSDQRLKSFAGWSADSGMAARYVHLSSVELVDPILEYEGIRREERRREPLARECPRCATVNAPDALYCRCGFALDLKAWQELKRQEATTTEELEAFKKRYAADMASIREEMEGKRIWANDWIKRGIRFEILSREEMLATVRDPTYRKEIEDTADEYHVVMVPRNKAELRQFYRRLGLKAGDA